MSDGLAGNLLELVRQLRGEQPGAGRVSPEGLEAGLLARIIRSRLTSEAAREGSGAAESLGELLDWLAVDRRLLRGFPVQPGEAAGPILDAVAGGPRLPLH